MATWSYVALIVRISLWVIIQVLIVRLFLAAVVLNVGWPDRGDLDETVLFVVVDGLVIGVGFVGCWRMSSGAMTCTFFSVDTCSSPVFKFTLSWWVVSCLF